MTRRVYTAHEYQQIAIDFMLENKRCALFAGMGLGKTVSALTVAEILIMCGWDEPILVLGPLRVARDTWPKELGKWQHLKDLSIMPIVGEPRQRRSALFAPAHIHTVNYEQLPWLIESLDGQPWPFKMVIADESTRLKGYRLNKGGIRSSALGKVARQTDRWIDLTGTPAPNGLKDLWGQFWFLDFGERLGYTYTAFEDRWFKTCPYTRRVKAMPHAEKEIYSRIDDITLAIRSEDWFDLEKPIEKNVRVQLSPALRAQYRQLEADMFTKLACGTEVEVFNAAALTNKCLQFGNGAVYTDTKSGAWASVHDEKIEALKSIVEESGGAQLLVAYEFVSDKERILKAFGKRAVDISKPAGYKAFMSGDAQLGVAHPKSMGHGIDGLQDVCNIAVYFGHGWDLELRQQILERIGPVRQMQSGHNRNVFIYSIVTDDTLDDAVLERHKSKREVQDLLLEAMSQKDAPSAAELQRSAAVIEALKIMYPPKETT
jgi:hypothetical protein